MKTSLFRGYPESDFCLDKQTFGDTEVESTTIAGKLDQGNRLMPMNGRPGSCPSVGLGASGARFYQMPFLAPTITEETLESGSLFSGI